MLKRLTRRRATLALLTSILTSLSYAAAGPAAAGDANNGGPKVESYQGREVAPGEVLVKFRKGTPSQAIDHAKAEADVSLDRGVGGAGARLFRSRSKDTQTLVGELSARADVIYAEPNHVIRVAAAPSDPRFPEVWGLQNVGQNIEGVAGIPGADIGAADAWGFSTGSRDNVVAVGDTGIDYNHPDLAQNMWSAPAPFTVNIGGQSIRCEAGTHGFNVLTRSCDPIDDHDHGTHLAGIIGAAGNNGLGVVGVNWTASIMGLKFFGADGIGYTSWAIDGIEFAIQAKRIFGAGANVRVLSNSWGGGDFNQALLDQINRANQSDMLFVAVAGNSYGGERNNDVSPVYPGSYQAPNVISVAATNNRDELASFSHYGPNSVHLGAPGVDILSTVRGGDYYFWGGTSMAVPHVSGAAALILSRCTLDTAGLKSVLLDNVDQIPSLSGMTITGGRLNVSRAIRACAPDNSAPVARAGGPYSGAVGQAVRFDGRGSTDADGTVSSYSWEFGDGTSGTGPTPTHVYALAGVYAVTLTVTDDRGATGRADTTATISQPPPAAPTNLTASSPRSGEVALRWADKSANEQGFEVERSASASGGFVRVAAVGPNVTGYTDAGLQKKQTYYYRVRAVNGGGASGYSNTAKVSVK